MAVSSFKKSGGLVALAIGLAFALPAAASAQDEGGRPMWRQQRAQPAQAAPQAQDTQQAQVRQQRGGGEGSRSWRRDNPQAQAQTQGQQSWRGNDQTRGQRWGGRGEQTRQDQQAWQQQQLLRQQQVQQQQQQRTWNRDRDGDSRWQRNDRNQARGDSRWQGGNTRWQGSNTRQWSNNWRRDNRYDWSSYRNSNRNVFRMGRYSAPYRNWTYRSLGIGFRLQPLFYSNNYWINDPGYYRLPEAYGPYRWVRYYDDALLVDIYSGEVVDVINNFFW